MKDKVPSCDVAGEERNAEKTNTSDVVSRVPGQDSSHYSKKKPLALPP